jgi:adenine-specific DNA-methyltransferase
MPELSFKGKEFVFNHHLAVPHRPLVPDALKSVGDARLDGNLVIHGDNLHGLKSLLPMYAGKVDCIFIDPPYNTGNEGWCYNDNVNSPMMQQWLSENPVGIEDGLRHDKWCAMMWPRLRLLHELLGEAGSIWITLDDNEVHHARMMLDEIFGEDGFVANIVWQKKYAAANDHTGIAPMHDNVLVYSKLSWTRNKLSRSEEKDEQYRYSDDNGVFRVSDYTCNKTADERPNLYYAITNPNTQEEVYSSRSRVWAYSKEQHQENQSNGLVWWGKDGKSSTPAFKRYRHSLKDGGAVVPGTWWDWKFAGHTDLAKKTIRDVFPDLKGSEATITPKPLELILDILEIATNENSIILDSFAGSGTTAHAVLAANAKDGGERKFILVECEEYADSLTAERVRRVIGGYSFKGTQREELLRKSLTFTDLKKADKLLHEIAGIENLYSHEFDKIDKKIKDGELLVEGVKTITERVEGLGGSFTYCTLGEAVDLERMLTGENLPGFAQLGALLFHMATSEALDPAAMIEREEGCGYLGESSAFHVWLIYKPDLDFLKSRDSALTLTKARELAASKPAGKRHLVFAPAKFVSQKVLDEEQVPVEFAPLPWALYRIERS